MAVAPPLLVAAPTITPARFGLQSAADQQLIDPAQRIRNGVAWEPNPCGPAKLDPAECGDTPTDRDVPDGIGLDSAEPIVVYNGFTCRAVGLTEQAMLDRATASLLTEWVAVEQAVWASTGLRLMNDTTGEETAVLAEDPVPLVSGIGLLEGFLGANYGGIGVLHTPREVASHAAAAQQISTEPGRLVTVLGTRWAFGAGYPNTGPDGAPAAADTAWIVATGAVTYRRTEITHRPGSMREAFNYANNEIRAIAERTYVVAWDECVRAAVPVSLT
ncbi:hypothetical protein IU459_11815 [Nocardia amamiensis]|uniref:Uncharacterized protein n=1 Tax=Nocardia amamiensis TaxID=404578 RepID=A0ABS0CNP7_9NOCA|nr:hypothetical protein [Nocardia amamiensis]MBF6298227.1 hypothetical protein [Nocardia amamiensis]